jgi:ribosomal protein L16/L10AE
MAVSHVSKFKKYHKQMIRVRSQAQTLREPTFGTFALRTKEASRFTEWHLEAVQKGLRRSLKKNGYI